MTDMVELRKRKEPLNCAILEANPGLFAANLLSWLEITAFISALRAGATQIPEDGLTPTRLMWMPIGVPLPTASVGTPSVNGPTFVNWPQSVMGLVVWHQMS